MSSKSLGQIAYDAWRGRHWGTWESLLPENQQPWEVAALAVAKTWERRRWAVGAKLLGVEAPEKAEAGDG